MNSEGEAIRAMFRAMDDVTELIAAFGTPDEGGRGYLERRRQVLIMELGAVEDLLGVKRSIIPRHKR